MYALPEGGTEDAKIKALSVDNPKLVTVLTFEARVGQTRECSLSVAFCPELCASIFYLPYSFNLICSQSSSAVVM